MTSRCLPLLPIRRALVPGTRAGLPCTDPHLVEGEHVAAVLAVSGGDPGARRRVATRAQVEQVRPLGPEASLVRLGGRSLVRLTETRWADGRWWAGVAELAEPGPGAATRLAETQRSLRRYLALRAEAGEAGAGPLTLSRDPVAASHEVASVLRISWPEVQELLEAGSAADRLRRAQAVLDREAELLRRLLGREGT
jgi:Lon protease-like protein